MAQPDFEETWYPRIGKRAAEELRRARKLAWPGPVAAMSAAGAGALIGTNSAGDVIGGVLALVGVVYVWAFIPARASARR